MTESVQAGRKAGGRRRHRCSSHRQHSTGRFAPANTKLAAATVAAVIGIGAGATHLAHAANGTYTGGGTDALWENPANWQDNIVPGATSGTSSADVVSLATTPLQTTVTVDANRNIAGFSFDTTTTTPFDVGAPAALANTGHALILSGGGTTRLEGGAPAAVTEFDINSPVILAGNSYTLTNNSGDIANTTGALRIFGNVTPAATGTTVFTLDGDHGGQSSCRAELYGAFVDGAGVLSIVKNGVGTWEMNQDSGRANTYSGDTVINGGILRASNGTPDDIPYNGLGGFSPNSHYIVNNGGTLRNSVVGSTIRKLTVNFGGIVNVSTANATLLNVKSDSGPAINLNFATNTHSNDIALNLPFGLTGTVADEGGVTLLANPNPGGTGRVTFGSSTGFFNMGDVRRVFDIGRGVGADYDLRIQGRVTGTAGFIKTGPGTLRFSGPATSPMTGQIEIREGTFNPSVAQMFDTPLPLLISGGTLRLQSGHTQTFGAVTVTKGEMTGGDNNVVVAASSFAFNVDGTDTARADVILADYAGATGVTKNGTGTVNVEISPTYTGTTTVNAGTLAFAANFTPAGAVNVTGGTLKLSASDTEPNRVMKVDNFAITGDGRIDLTRNKLLTATAPGTFDGAAYTGVQGEVQRAYNFGAWDMPGLTTSEENAGQNAGPLSGTTTIGVATAEQVLFVGPTDTVVFVGQTITGATTIAMYTYAGDVNFDGLVDGADYGTLDNWIQFPGTDGYANGDVNYDGVIDGADYGVLDNTIQLQGPPLPGVNGASGGLSAGVTAVPEPSACGFAVLGAAALIGRRRRRSHA